MKCSRVDCQNEATHYPVLKMWAIGQDIRGTPAEAILPLPTCEQCTKTLTIADIVSDDGYLQIVNTMAIHRMNPPDRKTMQLSWIEKPDERGVVYVKSD